MEHITRSQSNKKKTWWKRINRNSIPTSTYLYHFWNASNCLRNTNHHTDSVQFARCVSVYFPLVVSLRNVSPEHLSRSGRFLCVLLFTLVAHQHLHQYPTKSRLKPSVSTIVSNSNPFRYIPPEPVSLLSVALSRNLPKSCRALHALMANQQQNKKTDPFFNDTHWGLAENRVLLPLELRNDWIDERDQATDCSPFWLANANPTIERK